MPEYTSGDAQAIIDNALRAAIPNTLDPEQRFHAVVTADGVEVIDLEDHQLDAGRPRPRRAHGTYRVHDAGSFVDYLNRHTTAEAEVWADLANQRLTAVLNAHAATAGLYPAPTGEADDDEPDEPTARAADAGAGWQDHRLVLDLRRTPEWEAWSALSGQLCDQNTLAEHIEDHIGDIVRPPGAEMLELVQTFQATTAARFESSRLLSSGERQLTYKEQTDASAGRNAQLTIPYDFNLALTPFDGLAAYRVTARFRYRIREGHLSIGYVLNRPEDVLREAFTEQLDIVAQAITAPIYRGTAP